MSNALTRAESLYASLGQSDFSGWASEYLADDIVWENPLPALIPFGGTFRGHHGVLRYFAAVTEHLDIKPLHWDEFVGDESVVVAIGVESDTLVRSTGKRYTMPCVHVLRFDDNGKVTRLREYNDITEMIAAFTADPQ